MAKLSVIPAAGAWRSHHPLSPGIRAGDVLWMAASAPGDLKNRQPVAGDITAQTEACFDNLEAHLKGAGASLDDVVKCTVYLTSAADIEAMNAVYARRFRAPYPGRATVIVAGLVNPAYRLVIDTVACPGQGPRAG